MVGHERDMMRAQPRQNNLQKGGISLRAYTQIHLPQSTVRKQQQFKVHLDYKLRKSIY